MLGLKDYGDSSTAFEFEFESIKVLNLQWITHNTLLFIYTLSLLPYLMVASKNGQVILQILF